MKKIGIIILFIICAFIFWDVTIKAYTEPLDIEFDICSRMDYYDENDIGDGYYEKWYDIIRHYGDYYYSEHMNR